MDTKIYFAVILMASFLHAALCMKEDKDGSGLRSALKKSASERKGRTNYDTAKVKWQAQSSKSSNWSNKWSFNRSNSGSSSDSDSPPSSSPDRRDVGRPRTSHPSKRSPKPAQTSPVRSETEGTGLVKKVMRTANSFSGWMPWSPTGRSGNIPKPYASPTGLSLMTHLHPFKWKTLEKIEINYGDIVVCHLLEQRLWRRTHWFLAMNWYELLHIYPKDKENQGLITQDEKSEIGKKFPKFDSSSCKNLGNGGYNLFEMIARAEKWVNRLTFYDEESCGSYHWVVYWVTGKPPQPKLLVPGFNSPLHEKCHLNSVDKKPAPLKTDPIQSMTIDEGVAVANEFPKKEGWPDDK